MNHGRIYLILVFLQQQLNSVGQVFNFDVVDIKAEGSAIDEKSSFKMLGLCSLLNIIGVLSNIYKTHNQPKLLKTSPNYFNHPKPPKTSPNCQQLAKAAYNLSYPPNNITPNKKHQ